MSGEDFDAFASMGGMQMNSQEDAFADAGLGEMDGGMDFNQGFGESMPQAKGDDYTEEELQQLAQVE